MILEIIITIVKDQCEKYEADLVLKQAFGESIEICVLDDYTSSQSETVVETLKRWMLQGHS